MKLLKLVGFLLFVAALLGACAAVPAPRSSPPEYAPFPDVLAVEALAVENEEPPARMIVVIATGDNTGRAFVYVHFEDDSIGLIDEVDGCTYLIGLDCGAPPDALTFDQRRDFRCWSHHVIDGGRPILEFDCAHPEGGLYGTGYNPDSPAVIETADRLRDVAWHVRGYPVFMPVAVR